MGRTIIELNPATQANPADLILIRQGSEDRRLTIQDLGSSIVPSRATETEAGTVILATNAETQAQTVTDKAITPANLGSVTSTTDRQGLIEIATNSEALAGTNTSLAIVPSSLQHVLENTPLGATGGGNDQVFFQNQQNVTVNYTVPSDRNAITAGPITVNDGVTVTVADGASWVVV